MTKKYQYTVLSISAIGIILISGVVFQVKATKHQLENQAKTRKSISNLSMIKKMLNTDQKFVGQIKDVKNNLKNIKGKGRKIIIAKQSLALKRRTNQNSPTRSTSSVSKNPKIKPVPGPVGYLTLPKDFKFPKAAPKYIRPTAPPNIGDIKIIEPPKYQPELTCYEMGQPVPCN